MTCHLYLVSADATVSGGEDWRGLNDIFKVGITNDPAKRLPGIQTGCPFRVSLVKSWVLPDRETARLIEDRFHRQNAKWRTSGEWFLNHAGAACFNISFLLIEHWLETKGRERLLEFLRSTGMARRDAFDAMIQYGVE